MFKPKYTISPKLLENIKQISVLISELNNSRYPIPVLVELERSAREISAHSSTSIEGNPLALTDVKRLLKTSPKKIRETEREVLNYNEMLKLLNNKLDKVKIDISNKLVLDIQKGIMKDLISRGDCGHYRKAPVFVNNPKLGKTIYLPPEHNEMDQLMNELVEFIKDNKKKTDPLILAGIFHKQFVIIHPFIDGNGRTARLVTKVLLASLGIDTFNLFSFENYYNKNVSEYFEKVGVFGNYYDILDQIDFTEWLEYFSDGIIDELQRVKKLLREKLISPETELKPHHRLIIKFIENNGYITDADYAKISPRAKATRVMDFNRLIDLQVIERINNGRNTYYRLKDK